MAGRYICPVCDRRLQMKHFCTYCKSFVKEPVYYTGPVANESYDSAGRPGCMADQHYGLGHVHHPGDRQREYGHHKAGVGAGRKPSARQNTYARGSRAVRQSGRTGQNGSRQQTEGASHRVKKFFAVFWVAFAIIMLAEAVSFTPFTFLWQILNVVFQIGFFALIIWVIVWNRNIRRK